MRVHHLNCATMCPRAGALVNAAGRLVCHVLLVETEDGLVLVDTGFGLLDVASPVARLGHEMLFSGRPKLDRDETAAHQVERLGFKRTDVKHVVPTHLDLDHVGGVPDFPHATVHVHAREHADAMNPPGFLFRRRYRTVPRDGSVKWQLHTPGGDRWFGFESVRALPGAKDEVLLVPLRGHTFGHCGVAVRRDDGKWFLHAGDAYFHADEMHPTRPRCTPGLAFFQRFIQADGPARVANQARLRELARNPDVRVFSAHDPTELDAARALSASARGTGDPVRSEAAAPREGTRTP